MVVFLKAKLIDPMFWEHIYHVTQARFMYRVRKYSLKVGQETLAGALRKNCL